MNLTGKVGELSGERIETFRVVLFSIITLYFLLDSMFKGIYHGKQAHNGKSVVPKLPA